MAAFSITQMHERLVTCLIDSTAGAIGLFERCLCIRRYGSQSLERGNRQARNKF